MPDDAEDFLRKWGGSPAAPAAEPPDEASAFLSKWAPPTPGPKEILGAHPNPIHVTPDFVAQANKVLTEQPDLYWLGHKGDNARFKPGDEEAARSFLDDYENDVAAEASKHPVAYGTLNLASRFFKGTTGLDPTGLVAAPRVQAAAERQRRDAPFALDVAMAASEGAGMTLPVAGAGKLAELGRVPAALRAPLAFGAYSAGRTAVEGGSKGEVVKSGLHGAAFAALTHVFGAGVEAVIRKMSPEVADAFLTRIANGGVSMAAAGQVLNGPDPEAAARDLILGAGFTAFGTKTGRFGDREDVASPETLANRQATAEAALRLGRDPVADVNASRLGRTDPFAEPTSTAPVALPPQQREQDPAAEARGRTVLEAVQQGVLTPQEAFSPERAKAVEGKTPEEAKAILESMPEVRRPDGSVSGPTMDPVEAIKGDHLDPAVVPLMAEAAQKGVDPVTSGKSAEGVPFVVGRDSTGKIVRIDGQAPEGAATPTREEVIPQAPVEAAPAIGEHPAERPISEPLNPQEIGVKPAERPVGDSGDATSIKNRVMERERIERGLGPMAEPIKESFGQWANEAMDRIAKDPHAPDELVRDLTEKPRSHDKVEAAMLTIHKVDLLNRRDRVMEEGIKAAEMGDKDAEASANREFTSLEAQMNQVDTITKSSGTEAGRNLASRKMMMNRDHSLAAMETRVRIAKGSALTPQEVAQTKALHDQLAKAIAERDAYQARITELEAARPSKRDRTSRAAPGSPEYGRRNKIVTQEAYEKAKAELKEILSRTNVGIPVEGVTRLVKMGVYHLEAGVREFTDWAKLMTSEFGDKIRPNLREAFDAAKAQFKDNTLAEVSTKVREGLKEGKGFDKMGGSINRLAEMFTADGVQTRGELVQKVHEVLSGLDPSITLRQTRDLISKYGQVTPLNKDPVKVQLRELKGQMQQESKLEDMASGKAPLRTGPERQPPGDIQRELIKQVNEAKKRGGYGTPDPVTQLKSAMDAVKTRLRNEMADMQRQIDAKVKDSTKRTGLKYDAEAEALKQQRDALREVYETVFGKSEMTVEQRVQIALKAVEKSTAEWARRVETGDVFPAKRESKTPSTPELEAAKAKRAELVQQAADIRAAAKGSQSWSQIAEQARNTRLEHRIAQLEQRAATGVYTTPERPTIPATADSIRLESRVQQLLKAEHEAIFRAKLASENVRQKAVRAAFEATTTARSIMTSFDLSAVFRQGGIIAFAHPVRAAKGFGEMLRAFKSPEAAQRSEAALMLRPTYGLAKRAGLFLSEHGNIDITKMEEAYMSRWAEHLPGVAGSQRAYTTFLNRLRMDSFDAMVSTLSENGTPTPKEAQAIANYINIATGRGGGTGQGKMAQIAAGLNGIFFSPRLVASRFQMLAGTPLYGGSGRTRALVAKEYARFLSGAAIVYGLGMAAGGSVSSDSKDPDFLKIKFGDTRVDPLAGLLQVTRLLSDTGKAVAESFSDDRRKPTATGWPERTGRFLRSKLAPIVGAAYNAVSGKTLGGEKTSWGKEALGLVTPMSGKDIYEAMKSEGIPEGAALGILSIFGMGLQTYSAKHHRR